MAQPYAIALHDGIVLEDIYLDSALVPPSAKLRFLSVVETDRIPLHLTLGTSCDVSTTNFHTSAWFSTILSRSLTVEADAHNWWQQARTDSPLGVLVAIDHDDTTKPTALPGATELLFYAVKDKGRTSEPLTPPVSSSTPGSNSYQLSANVRAIALSSELAIDYIAPSPPPSPWAETNDYGVFLSRVSCELQEVIHEPPTKRRRTAHDAFDEATERRKQAKRKGGQRVSSAAPSVLDTRLGPLRHQRSTSASTSSVPLQTRPLSRAGSVVSVDSHAGTAKSGSVHPERRSKLSSNTTTDVPSDEVSQERKNKDVISRVVMAGMRLHGLVQDRLLKANGSSNGNAAAPGTIKKDDPQEHDEYKLVYHQVFKGACFAFRKHIRTLPVSQHTDATRKVVDELLALYCKDPLVSSGFAEIDEVTPSGRVPFGSARSLGENAFSAQSVGMQHGTPSVRRVAPVVI